MSLFVAKVLHHFAVVGAVEVLERRLKLIRAAIVEHDRHI